MSSPRLTVDLGALATNWRTLQTAAAHAGCAESGAVVKANAYGLGVEPVAHALASLGCRRFFVATLPEGEALRDILPRATSCEIHVLSGPTDAATAAKMASAGLTPTLNDPHQLELWKRHRHRPAAIHIDTGMNRLGFPFESVDGATFQGFEIAVVMSHLACADTPDHPLNAVQRARCERIAAMFQGIPTSFANSAAACTGNLAAASQGRDIARLGIGLYGGNPLTGQPSPVTPVATLDAPILSIRHATGGETIGYGATHTLTRASTLAVIAAGYADGIPRTLGGRGTVACRGHRLPILGRISMDTLTIDATSIAETLHAGERAELFGRNVSLDEAASLAGTIPYELLVRIGPRVERRYLRSPQNGKGAKLAP
ncbi:MAG: alanine racemase [Gammaproteobacteria bacterium]|nr:alanine racemase [Gammaproteobacteria bacterium]